MIAIVAPALTLGLVAWLVLGSSRTQPNRITLHFAGFTNAGTQIEALFAVSNNPGGFTMEAVSVDRRDESRWIRESTSNVPVVPHAPSVMGRPFSALPTSFIGVPVSTSNSSIRVVTSVQECKRGLAGWTGGIRETVQHVDTGTGLNGASYLLTNEITVTAH